MENATIASINESGSSLTLLYLKFIDRAVTETSSLIINTDKLTKLHTANDEMSTTFSALFSRTNQLYPMSRGDVCLYFRINSLNRKIRLI